MQKSLRKVTKLCRRWLLLLHRRNNFPVSKQRPSRGHSINLWVFTLGVGDLHPLELDWVRRNNNNCLPVLKRTAGEMKLKGPCKTMASLRFIPDVLVVMGRDSSWRRREVERDMNWHCSCQQIVNPLAHQWPGQLTMKGRRFKVSWIKEAIPWVLLGFYPRHSSAVAAFVGRLMRNY